MSACFVRGVSVLGPGLTLWPQARAVLRGEAALDAAGAVVPPPPALLAPNERRRAGLPTRIALAVCAEAVAMSGLGADRLACVFASANGEGSVVHGLLETLSGPDRQVSPTQFHNSVHNAVAGYWSIGTRSMQGVTCLACADWSFGAGLLQAVAACSARRQDVLLCVYDAPIPPPLGDGRPTAFPFACALVLSPEAGEGALVELSVEMDAEGGEVWPRHPGLRTLAAGNAAARGLRLLEAVATGGADGFWVELPSSFIQVCTC